MWLHLETHYHALHTGVFLTEQHSTEDGKWKYL